MKNLPQTFCENLKTPASQQIRINAKSAEGGDSLMVAKMSTVVPVNTKDCGKYVL